MRDETSPTSRALLALEVLQGSPGITSERLAARLGVSTRAVRRYVEILREADIPVESVRGPAGGYRLGRGMRLPPLVFSASEALGLVMAVLDGHHDPADTSDPVGSAVSKLLRALPTAVAAQANSVRMVTAPAPDHAAARPDPETTVVLVGACADHRRIRLDYRSEAGKEWTLEAEPWSVVVRYGRWYLLCRSVSADAVRAYRVDRMSAVVVLDETFEPPADLDPVPTLEAHLGVGWEHGTEILLDTPLADATRWVPRGLGRLEAVDDTTTRLVGSTSNPTWYAAQLVELPVTFRIVGGPELRESVQRLGARLTRAAGD